MAIIAACGDDSTGLRAADYARHFDSLYTAAVANDANPLSIRRYVLSDLEIAAAFGATPRVVTVTTASGVEQWKGVEFISQPNGNLFEFRNVLAAYRESDAHTVLEVEYVSDGSVLRASLLVDDSVDVQGARVSGHSTVTAHRDGCPSPAALENHIVEAFTIGTCATAEFSSSMAADFAAIPDADPALTHLELGPTTFAGEIFDSGFGDSVTVHP